MIQNKKWGWENEQKKNEVDHVRFKYVERATSFHRRLSCEMSFFYICFQFDGGATVLRNSHTFYRKSSKLMGFVCNAS